MKRVIELLQRPRVSLRWKLLGGFLATNILLIVALGFALSTIVTSTETLETIKGSSERSRQIANIESYQNSLVTSALDYSWSENLARLNDYEIAGRNLDRAIEGFQPNPLQETNYDLLRKEYDSLSSILDRVIAYGLDDHVQQAQTLWKTLGSKQATRAQAIAQELAQQELHLANLQYNQAVENAKVKGFIINVLTVLALVVAIGLAYLFTAAVTRPLSQLRNRLADLANGDLTQSVVIANRDELGELGQTYNSTLASLRELVKQLYSQSQLVTSASEEITSQSRTQVLGSSQQASAITEATRALQELSQTAREIARQAFKATEAVELSLQRAHAVSNLTDEMTAAQEVGRATVARTVTALHNLKDQVVAIEENQQALVSQSATIQQVIGLIDNIAKETHLLALNAAIEAAGAGSYGSRFAVIAGEVKQLADRSLVATKQVRASLGGISSAVERASISATEGLQEAAQAVSEAGDSDKALLALTALSQQIKEAALDIVDYIEGTAALATHIGVATQQQQVASQQMLETMVQIEAVTAQTLSSVRQSENATQRLNLSARELENSADAFRLVAA